MFFCFFSLLREYVFFENLLFPSSDSVQPFADEPNVGIQVDRDQDLNQSFGFDNQGQVRDELGIDQNEDQDS